MSRIDKLPWARGVGESLTAAESVAASGEGAAEHVRTPVAEEDTLVGAPPRALSAVATTFVAMPVVTPLVPFRDRVLLDRRILKPRWEGLDRQPYVPVEPAPTLNAPLRAGDFLLWVDLPSTRALFTLAVPRVLHFSLTVQKEIRDDTIKITGGTAVLAVCAYEVSDTATAALLEMQWSSVLAANGFEGSNWRFQPLSLRNLDATLQLDAAHLTRPPQVTASGELGTATFVIELSQLGAQIWKDALETSGGSSLSGVCSLNARYYAQLADRVEVKEQVLSAPLGTLLGGVGAEALHVVNPQVSFEARVIVAGHPTVAGTVVNWLPSEGHAPQSLSFDETGGQFSALLTAQNVEGITIDWDAVVRFKPPGWPDIRQSGKLSVAGNDWSLVLKPGSWLTTRTISAVLLDANGEVIPDADFNDPNSRVQAELAFTAPFLKGKALRSTLFEADSEHAVTVAFPNPPDEKPGRVRLTIFATRGGKLRAKRRLLKADESLVAVMISPDARITIVTSHDKTLESSVPAEVLRHLARLG
jgi:hypothetical protein